MTAGSSDDTTVSITLTGSAVDVTAAADTFTRRALKSMVAPGADDSLEHDDPTIRGAHHWVNDWAVAVAQLVEVGHVDEHTPLTLTLTRSTDAVVVTVPMPGGAWDDADPELRSLVAAIATEPVVVSDGAVRAVFAVPPGATG